ncbi:MAG: glycoside hydrolase family 95 protein [Armatimonadetes bacterium]|nr:glycoside hydrolase family 95 protein [Armatimonadota bacterium]
MLTRAAPSLALIGAVVVASGQVADTEPDVGGNFLWYEQPAESWVEALPVGNGRLGAMVFGAVTEERIQLNIDSLWAGPPFPTVPDGAADALQEARRLFFAGKPAEGQQVIAERFLAERISPRSQQTLGDLRLKMSIAGMELPRARIVTEWRRGPVDDDVRFAHLRDAFDDSSWDVIKASDPEGRSVPENSTVVFRTVLQLTALQASRLNRLQLSPIDDASVIYLNGLEVGRTTAYSQPHRFKVPAKLRSGKNVLAIAVTNRRGPGHLAAEVRIEAVYVPAAYVRSLNLNEAVATTSYRIGKTTYRRQVFASAKDGVLAVRLTADALNSLTFEVSLSRAADAEVYTTGSRMIVMSGQASHDGENKGAKYVTALHIVTEGGRLVVGRGAITVTGANAATIYLAAETDYNMADPSSPLTDDLKAKCFKTLDAVLARNYEDVRLSSVNDHKRYYDRVRLRLGGGSPGLPTDVRLRRVQGGATDPGLAALYFQYGRYLLICSSRPGTLPANLQGLWNEHIEAPWNADYHTNINVQMNYWPAEVTNLSELHGPFFWLIDGLRPSGRETARAFGMRGFAAGHTTDPWLWTAPSGQPVWAMWPMGAGWSSAHYMEHYRFTQDERFLKDRAWPVLKECAEFFLDWLVEDPRTGKLVSGPTTSPENVYLLDGKRLSLSMGTAMDHQIIWEVFTNVLESAEVLGIDDDLVASVRGALARLAAPQIGSDGRLLEWDREYEEPIPGHRHMSHLYGLHPSSQFTHSGTPELVAAARKSLEHRLENGGGHTGWSRAWIINFWARLLEPEKALENFDALLAKSTHPNLFDNHPPFQIDGNFGGTAGIAEMLVQSHEGFIRLLPALPGAWGDGEVAGLRTRGGYEIAMKWSDGQIEWVRIKAAPGDGLVRIMPPPGTKVQIASVDSRGVEAQVEQGVFSFPIPAGQLAFVVFARQD